MAEVVITGEQLRAAKACSVYLTSPEWDGEKLVYADWDASKARLASTRAGMTYLGFLVRKNLVPMTIEEYRDLVSQQKQQTYARIEEEASK